MTALVLSGGLPASGVLIEVLRRRRLEVVGLLELAGILVGTVLGAGQSQRSAGAG